MEENDNLLDLAKKNETVNSPVNNISTGSNAVPFQNKIPVQTTPIIDHRLDGLPQNMYSYSKSEGPKKSKLWLWIVLAVVILGLAGAGYWYLSPKQGIFGDTALNKYNQGPDLDIDEESTNPNIFYSSDMDAFIYQKRDSVIYTNILLMDLTKRPVLNTMGGILKSVSPDGKYAILYYPLSPIAYSNDTEADKTFKNQLIDAKNNFYLANLENNKLTRLGPELINFTWGKDKVYFARYRNKMIDVLCYDLNKASATDFGGVSYEESYDKIVGLKYIMYAMEFNPQNKKLYFVSNKDNSNFQFQLATYDFSSNQFTEIMKTNAISISFSPSGKYYVLYNRKDRFSVYDIENNLIAEVTGVTADPMKVVWSKDENAIYYFSSGDQYFGSIGKEEYKYKYYSNLKKLDLKSKENTTLIVGKDKNLADPLDIALNYGNNSLFITTEQSKNIYKLGMQ